VQTANEDCSIAAASEVVEDGTCKKEQSKFITDNGQEHVMLHACKNVNAGGGKTSVVHFHRVKPTNDESEPPMLKDLKFWQWLCDKHAVERLQF